MLVQSYKKLMMIR